MLATITGRDLDGELKLEARLRVAGKGNPASRKLVSRQKMGNPIVGFASMLSRRVPGPHTHTHCADGGGWCVRLGRRDWDDRPSMPSQIFSPCMLGMKKRRKSICRVADDTDLCSVENCRSSTQAGGGASWSQSAWRITVFNATNSYCVIVQPEAPTRRQTGPSPHLMPLSASVVGRQGWARG
jgi:hypothetical protein